MQSQTKKKIILVFYIIVILSLIFFLEWWGIIGLLVFFFGFIIIRLIKSRHMFMQSLRVAEGQIFGKPLDRELWDKGELKNTKVKFVWRKKHDKPIPKAKETTDQ